MISELEKISEVDTQSLVLYARLCQLEKWLREMVYIELKVKKGRNWVNFNKTKSTYEAEQELHHIPSADHSPLSYTTFSDLAKLIKNNWDLFTEYLPPQKNWEVKFEEITHIRNRVAHFRRGHQDDLDRLLQLMRDIDAGFWKFCTDYNDIHPILPPDKDPISQKYIGLDPFSYKEVAPNEWARIGSAPDSLRYIVSINMIKRSWAQSSEVIDGTPGYIYDVNIHIKNQQQFDYTRLLTHIKTFKPEIIHICLDNFADSARVTLPAVIGSEKAIDIIDEIIKLTDSSLTIRRPMNINDNWVQEFSEEWPEYVLGPKNPLTFLCPDMPCSFFNVLKKG